MTAALFTICGATGVFLLYTRVAFGWRTLVRRREGTTKRPPTRDWLVQAGLGDVGWREFGAACATSAGVAFLVAYALFGGIVPSFVAAGGAATWPVLAWRSRRLTRVERARASWPRLIEEIRVLTGSAGASIPQALYHVGRRAPLELRPAFERSHREWLLTTDFARALTVLKAELADATADTVCETLLTAFEIGGVDLDRRLADLAEDRLADVHGRRDARARLAGARFARAFVLAVPIVMALVGLSIGDGRAAYATGTGQLLVAVGLVVMAACWAWAGRLMVLPDDQRVFA